MPTCKCGQEGRYVNNMYCYKCWKAAYYCAKCTNRVDGTQEQRKEDIELRDKLVSFGCNPYTVYCHCSYLTLK